MLAEKIIRKHVSLIHAYSMMSVLQRKIVNVLFYEAVKGNNRLNHQTSVAIECNMSFATLCKAVKFNSNNTQYMKEAIDGLASLKIEWNLLKDKAPSNISFVNLRILHGSPTFFKDNTFNFSFHKVMLHLVENPLIYGSLDMDLQSAFESKYGHALYENSTRFVNLQKKKIVQLETFRKILGVPDGKYSTMREITRNVITPSVEEVNDRANFYVSLESVKIGRKIVGFEFSVKNKVKSLLAVNPLILPENEKINKEINEAFGAFNNSILENILHSYSQEYLLEKIAYTKKYAKKDKVGLYPIPYFISAVKHDYKFKVEHPPQNIHENNQDENSKWQNKLQLLQSDLRHWEKLFEYTNKGGNESQINNISKVILNCKEKLKKHYLKQPSHNKIV